MKKNSKSEKEIRKELKKAQKKKQEAVLSEFAHLMEEEQKTAHLHAEEIEEFSGFIQEQSSVAGRMLGDIMYSVFNDLAIGKKSLNPESFAKKSEMWKWNGRFRMLII